MRLPFLTGNSAMIEMVRAFDWATTPVGEPDGWPPELIVAASFVLESKFPAALFWGPSLVTIYNDGFRPILGDKAEALGRSWDEVWSEVWTDLDPIVKRAFSGEATFQEDMELTIDRFGRQEQANFTFCYSPVRSADGTVQGVIDTVIETTTQVQSRARSAMLNDELGHRLKNTMSMVQAIASQSLKTVADREVVNSFNDRITTLGRAHDILQRQHWEQAPMREVVARTIKPHEDGGRIGCDGPAVLLGAKAVLSLSLLLHELATNATKHGALSVAGGQVALVWDIEDDAELVLRWQETGGPPAREPHHRGFGTRLIDMGLIGTGSVTKRYDDEGFSAEFRAPLRHLLTA